MSAQYISIQEGKAVIKVPKESKISKDLPVFYNPLMEYNRTVSIEVINALPHTEMQIADPLAGSGVRAVRFLKELPKNKIKKIFINDLNKKAVSLIKENLKRNKISGKYSISNKDANLFLLEECGFDYIDIDPFGSPNKFLNNAIERISRGGILAVTATDTAALCGTFKDSCERKYWAIPSHTFQMHEIGLRILIRKVQLMGMQSEKALIPIYSYAKDHYMRIFFECDKGKKKSIPLVKQHQMYNNAGPMWVGKLYDDDLRKKIKLTDSFATLIKEEFDTLGFFDVPEIMKIEKVHCEKKLSVIIDIIRSKGYHASRTQFATQGIKSDIPYQEFIAILKN